MSVPNFDFVPLPREENPDMAYQMASYSGPMQREIIKSRYAEAGAKARWAALLDGLDMDQLPSEGLSVADGKGFSGGTNKQNTLQDLRLRSREVNEEIVWGMMLNTGAHYRAIHGRHDSLRGIDESALYNLADELCISWRKLTFSNECPEYASSMLLWPDALAISSLLRVSPEATSEAYQSYKGRYSVPAFGLLVAGGIVGMEEN